MVVYNVLRVSFASQQITSATAAIFVVPQMVLFYSYLRVFAEHLVLFVTFYRSVCFYAIRMLKHSVTKLLTVQRRLATYR